MIRRSVQAVAVAIAAEATAAVRELMPPWVAVAGRDPRVASADIAEVEAPAVAGAVDRRRYEFAAGRSAARQAMGDLGMMPQPLPSGADRAPNWPDGMVGSISHSPDACVAVVARAADCRSLAIDLEPDTPLSAELLPTVCAASERAWLATRPDGAALATVIFSAKECVYKAWYPFLGRILDFQEVEISLDLDQGTFTADFGDAWTGRAADRIVSGRFLRAAGHVVTAVIVPNEADAPARLELPYLLVCPIAYHEAADGSAWVDPLWHRDLVAHLDHLGDLRVASPRLPLDDSAGLLRVEAPAGARLTFVPLPAPASLAAALRSLPATAAALLGAIRAARIVHSGAAGWPIPLGALANPLARVLGKPLVVVIESTFWRTRPGARPGVKDRIRHRAIEALARWSVRHAGLAVLTSEAYRETLATGARGEVLVAPATWISDTDILSDSEADWVWEHKPAVPRLLFAGRLNSEKGVGVLLSALRLLEEQGDPIVVDILGAGPMHGDCLRAASDLSCVQLSVHDPEDYGPAFFGFLRKRHALIVPSITDEQPRILYDAFSQAVPVIASATGGHRDCVTAGENGVLVPPGDVAALAATLAAAAADPEGLRAMGVRALASARARTHEAMHRTRAEALRRLAGV